MGTKHKFCHGTQVKSFQKGAVDVSLEVEEEAHSPSPKEAPQDEATFEVIDPRLAQDVGCVGYEGFPEAFAMLCPRGLCYIEVDLRIQAVLLSAIHLVSDLVVT